MGESVSMLTITVESADLTMLPLSTLSAPTDGGRDRAVAEVKGGAFHACLVRLHGGAQGRGIGNGFFVGIAAYVAVAHKLAVAVRVVQGLGKLRLGFGKLAFLFAQGRLKRAGINGDERVARLHILPLGKVDLLYFASYAGFYAHRCRGPHVANSVQQARHICPRNGLNPHRGRRHSIFFAVVLRAGRKAKQQKKRKNGQGVQGWFHGVPQKIEIADNVPSRARQKVKQGLVAVKKIVSYRLDNLRLPSIMQ